MYSARHDNCGHLIEEPDRRLTSRAALKRWCKEVIQTGKLPTTKLQCGNCDREIEPTHVFIAEVSAMRVRRIVPVTGIDGFEPRQWPELVELLLEQ